ncbi:hypothetical protein CAC42_452 [Sphaceloma murrayae]|uniref:Uncharacterized protein n=1 Tax=Sphaceloma murrayae TaxID=2082308 RepID=A0A2K1R3J4_9PEZI|nr:hypothetical protein CAC42_452 [Sphaceloma murrayae]
MAGLNVTPQANGQKVEWTVPDQVIPPSEDLVWSKGNPCNAIEFRKTDDVSVHLGVGDWAVVTFTDMGHTERGFAKVCAIRQFKNGDSTVDMVLVAWGYEINRISPDRRDADAVQRANALNLRDDGIAVSDHFQVMHTDPIINAVSSDPASKFVTEQDCAPENAGRVVTLVDDLLVTVNGVDEGQRRLRVAEVALQSVPAPTPSPEASPEARPEMARRGGRNGSGQGRRRRK